MTREQNNTKLKIGNVPTLHVNSFQQTKQCTVSDIEPLTNSMIVAGDNSSIINIISV